VPVTLKDIALRCGVSPSTVSDVLNGRARTWASEETRLRVQAVARELGYHPNTSARALRSGKTYAVACLFSQDQQISRSNYDGAAEIMASHLGAHGYHVELYVSPDQTRLMQRLEELVHGHTSDAFVLFGREQDVAVQGACLERYGVPFVVKGRHEAQFPHWAQVDYDHEAMMLRVVDHLIGLGHTRIAYVGYANGEVYSQHLLRGFHTAIESRIHQSPPDHFIACLKESSITPWIERWLALPTNEQPTALAIGAGNQSWYEVEEALARMGRVIGDGPGEFAVAGQAWHGLSLAFGHGHYFEDISLESLAETAVCKLLLPLLAGERLSQPVQRILPELRPVRSLELRRYCTFRSAFQFADATVDTLPQGPA
jgi:LacI family transcriptional regulator